MQRSNTPNKSAPRTQPVHSFVLKKQSHFLLSTKAIISEIHQFYCNIIANKNKQLRSKGLTFEKTEAASFKKFEFEKDKQLRDAYITLNNAIKSIFKEQSYWKDLYKKLLEDYEEIHRQNENLKNKTEECSTEESTARVSFSSLEYSEDQITPPRSPKPSAFSTPQFKGIDTPETVAARLSAWKENDRKQALLVRRANSSCEFARKCLFGKFNDQARSSQGCL